MKKIKIVKTKFTIREIFEKEWQLEYNLKFFET